VQPGLEFFIFFAAEAQREDRGRPQRISVVDREEAEVLGEHDALVIVLAHDVDGILALEGESKLPLWTEVAFLG